MRTTLSVTNYIQRTQINLIKEVPIIIRIKLLDDKRDISSGHRIPADLWNSKFNSVIGTSERARRINKLLELSRNKLYEIFTQLSYAGDVCLDDIIEKFHGRETVKECLLLKLVTEHNLHIKSRIGIDYTRSTYQKYWAMEVRVTQYVKEHLKKLDIPLSKLDTNFVSNFFLYLKDVHQNQHNSATKTTKNLKRVLSFAMEQGYINQNPFNGFKCGYKETFGTILSLKELQRIEQKTFTLPRLDLVKDLFLSLPIAFEILSWLRFFSLKS